MMYSDIIFAVNFRMETADSCLTLIRPGKIGDALGLRRSLLEHLRALLPFALLAMVGSLVFAWMCDAVGDHNGITAAD